MRHRRPLDNPVRDRGYTPREGLSKETFIHSDNSTGRVFFPSPHGHSLGDGVIWARKVRTVVDKNKRVPIPKYVIGVEFLVRAQPCTSEPDGGEKQSNYGVGAHAHCQTGEESLFLVTRGPSL